MRAPLCKVLKCTRIEILGFIEPFFRVHFEILKSISGALHECAKIGLPKPFPACPGALGDFEKGVCRNSD